MPVYFIAQVDIHDQAGYDSYAQQAGAACAGLDAKVLAADDTPEVVEGKWHGPRTVMIEFADEADRHDGGGAVSRDELVDAALVE